MTFTSKWIQSWRKGINDCLKTTRNSKILHLFLLNTPTHPPLDQTSLTKLFFYWILAGFPGYWFHNLSSPRLSTCTVFVWANSTWHQCYFCGEGQALSGTKSTELPRWNSVHSTGVEHSLNSTLPQTASHSGWVSQRETNEWLFSGWKHSFLHTAEMLPRLREVAARNENAHGKSSLRLLSFSDPLSIIFMNISTNCFSVTSLRWLNLTSAASFAQVLSILVL